MPTRRPFASTAFASTALALAALAALPPALAAAVPETAPQAAVQQAAGFSPAVAQQLHDLPGVREVVPLSF